MIDQLAKQLFTDITEKVSAFSDHADESKGASQLKAIIESALKKLNLVTREEFDAQTEVLNKTREKIDALEKQVIALEEIVKNHQ